MILSQTAYSRHVNRHHKIRECILATEQEYKLPKKLLGALIEQESNFEEKAINDSTTPSSFGLGQITLPTAKNFCKIKSKKELFQHDKNIKCTAKILKYHIKKYGTIPSALTAYRGGTPCKRNSEMYRPCTRLDDHYISSINRKRKTISN
jgi:soluble lytic murein transglycosylase-like protein